MRHIITVLASTLPLLGVLLFTSTTEASDYRYVQVPENTAIFDDINGEQIKVGMLVASEAYTLVAEDAKYYYVKFGNHTAYFPKALGLEIYTTNYSNMNNITFPNSTNVIITQRPVTVFEDIGDDKGYAVIGRNIRYPIVDRIGEYYRVDIGNRLGYISARFVEKDKGIPVLMYHNIVENRTSSGWGTNSMVINVDSFRTQMEYLSRFSWRTIELAELDSYMNYKANLTGKVVLITFDDGLLSTYKYAVPILREYGMNAVNFAIGDRIRGQAEPWDETSLQYMGLKEMDDSGDVLDNQTHTNAMHLRTRDTNTPYMLTYSRKEITADLEKGKIQMNKSSAVKSPDDVKYLAYPWGQYNDTAIAGSLDAGIRMAFTTERDNVRLGMNPMTLPRQGIAPRHTLEDFKAKLYGTYTE
ncbi:polysaccharide deacetylase family protein [Bacillus fonticola]|uniref:polysaccharide deacetylase family protein n=1 Tax=Bacillus fonticola TaxID=2728853 RepID=UPI001473C459|nr:polysaccharide deacetylase family protein [Bacillus fonticola]